MVGWQQTLPLVAPFIPQITPRAGNRSSLGGINQSQYPGDPLDHM